jgi:FAD/FMN-containing dehydrogenase
MALESLRPSLVRIVGKENVADDFVEIPSIHLQTYADVSANRKAMEKRKLCARPADAAQVSEIVTEARKERIAIIPISGSTTFFVSGGPVPLADESLIIDLRRMDRILEFDEKSGTVTVEAGVTVQKLRSYLERLGWWLPHHPESYVSATVVGAICNDGISPYSTKYGRPAEQVTKLRVVLPDGSICTIGNKTLFDNSLMLKNLFLGVNGSMGVIVEATFKIYPVPDTRSRALFGFASVADSCEAIKEISRAGLNPEIVMMPSKERVYNEALLPILSAVDVSTVLEGLELFVFVGYAGSRDVVEFSLAQTTKIVRAKGGREIDSRVTQSYWSNLTEVGAVVSPQMANLYKSKKYQSSRGGVSLSHLPQFLQDEKEILPKSAKIVDDGVTSYIFLPQLDADPICGILLDDSDPDSVSEFNRWLQDVSKLNKKLGGTIAAVGGTGTMLRDLVPIEMGDSLAVANKIKKAIDPDGIMNPGKI